MRTAVYSKKYKVFWAIYWAALVIFLLCNAGRMIGEADAERYLRVDGFVLLLTAIAASAAFCTFVLEPRRKADDGKWKKLPLKPWHLLLIPANALYCFWVIEYVNNDLIRDITPFYVLINLAGICIMTAILLLWQNCLGRTVMTIMIVWSSIAIAFYLVYAMRGEPMQIIDFTSMRTAFTVAGKFDWPFPRTFVTDIVLCLCLFAVYKHLPKIVLARKLRGKILLRAAALGIMIAGYFFYFNTGWNAALKIKTDLFAPIKTYKQYGTSVGFFCVGKYMRLLPPEGYSVKATEKIAERAAAETQDCSTTDVIPVNIIAIMNEAWADYSYAGDLRTNIDPMPYYHSMKEDTIKGHTLVCITGGGTAKTEYEFLSGNSVKRFPGMVPYVSYYTHDQYSLVTTLRDQGYRAFAMHPYKASNWKRPTAYQLLYFEDFYAEESFDEDAERIRGFISDRANYKQIIEMVEQKDDPSDRLFLFDITMQNHGGYSSENYVPKVVFKDYQGEDGDAGTVNHYLTLLKESDIALEYLIEHFKEVEEPTLIVMFGDHYPTIPDSMTENVSGKAYEELTFEEQQRYYATPFFIWANYDIPEAEDVLTSTNYLGTMMLDQTGLELVGFNGYLNTLMQQMPALNHQGYVTADGTHVKWEDAEEPYSTLEWEYECLQYNELGKKRDRLDWFFN